MATMNVTEATLVTMKDIQKPVPVGYRIQAPTGRVEDGFHGALWTLHGPGGHTQWFHGKMQALRYARWHAALVKVSERIVERSV